METKLEITNSYTKVVTVDFTSEEVNKRFDEKLKEVAPDVQIPGFRKGKAPKYLIKARFADILLDEMSKDILEKDIEKVLEDNEIKPLHIEKVDFDRPELGKPLSIITEVHVKPTIENVDYDGLELTKNIYIPTDESIDKTIEGILERSATLEEVDRAAETEDFIVGKLNDDLKYLPISDDLSDEMKEKFIGLAKGDVAEGDFIFPENYIDSTLRGKTISGSLTVDLIKTKQNPELNIDFMKNIYPEIENEADFRNKVKEDLIKGSEQKAKDDLKASVFKAISDKNEVEIPPSHIKNEVVRRFAAQYGLDPQRIPQEQQDRLVESIGGNIGQSIAANWLLERVAEIENIEVAEEEINKKLAELAVSFRMSAEAIKAHLENIGEFDQIIADIKTEKAVEIVIEKANITEKELDPAQEFASSEDDDTEE